MRSKWCPDCEKYFAAQFKVCTHCVRDRLARQHNTRFRTGAWYCMHCPLDPCVHSFANKYHAAQHTWQEHKVKEPEEDVDYIQGFAAQKKWSARQVVAESYEHKAFRDPGYSLIDFQADVGIKPGPDEPPFPKIDRRVK